MLKNSSWQSGFANWIFRLLVLIALLHSHTELHFEGWSVAATRPVDGVAKVDAERLDIVVLAVRIWRGDIVPGRTVVELEIVRQALKIDKVVSEATVG